jgi:quercetin dioxygenase-like cupin family protein
VSHRTERVRPTATSSATDRALDVLLAQLAWRRGKLAGRASLAVLEARTQHGEMPPLHVHHEPEALQVLEGGIVLFLGGESVRLEAGDSIVAPAGVPHTYRAESETVRYRLASFVASPGSYEGFVRAVARPMGVHADEPHEDDRVVETLAAANGITVLGPPGALPVVELAA